MQVSTYPEFTEQLLIWFDKHGRKNLPWQHPQTPYTVWVSEIMLQQTQVKTVIPYFEKFMARFPKLTTLAKADEDEVLALWAGLGYYSRGRNLHQAAKKISRDHQGIFPDNFQELIKLPGIGASTAAAILSLAFEKPAAILDGNVKRILSRYFLLCGHPEKSAIRKIFEAHAAACISNTRPRAYTQAIMDLGALICTPKNPKCSECPLQHACQAYQQDKVLLYPEKKAAKEKPIKAAQFLLLHNATSSQIYLEKQPAQGIWGGLWSLPKLEKNACYISHIESHHGLAIKNTTPLPHILHVFTHFKLNLYPRAVCVYPKAQSQVLPKAGRWFDKKEILALGLPKPIADVIKYFLNKGACLPGESV